MSPIQHAAPSSDFATRLLEARIRANLTQDNLADVVGVSQQAIAKWEGGLAVPRGEHRDTIARVLGVEFVDASNVGDAIAWATRTSNSAQQKIIVFELLMAELIIVTMLGQFTAEQKTAAQAQLAAAGVTGADPIRSQERRAAIVSGGAA